MRVAEVQRRHVESVMRDPFALTALLYWRWLVRERQQRAVERLHRVEAALLFRSAMWDEQGTEVADEKRAALAELHQAFGLSTRLTPAERDRLRAEAHALLEGL